MLPAKIAVCMLETLDPHGLPLYETDALEFTSAFSSDSDGSCVDDVLFGR